MSDRLNDKKWSLITGTVLLVFRIGVFLVTLIALVLLIVMIPNGGRGILPAMLLLLLWLLVAVGVLWFFNWIEAFVEKKIKEERIAKTKKSWLERKEDWNPQGHLRRFNYVDKSPLGFWIGFEFEPIFNYGKGKVRGDLPEMTPELEKEISDLFIESRVRPLLKERFFLHHMEVVLPALHVTVDEVRIEEDTSATFVPDHSSLNLREAAFAGGFEAKNWEILAPSRLYPKICSSKKHIEQNKTVMLRNDIVKALNECPDYDIYEEAIVLKIYYDYLDRSNQLLEPIERGGSKEMVNLRYKIYVSWKGTNATLKWMFPAGNLKEARLHGYTTTRPFGDTWEYGNRFIDSNKNEETTCRLEPDTENFLTFFLKDEDGKTHTVERLKIDAPPVKDPEIVATLRRELKEARTSEVKQRRGLRSAYEEILNESMENSEIKAEWQEKITRTPGLDETTKETLLGTVDETYERMAAEIKRRWRKTPSSAPPRDMH